MRFRGGAFFFTSMISSISTRVILPSPSRSYMLKAQLSFCSKLPRDVMDRAQMNSLKSMVPSLFLSKVRKACCANLDASPYGKNCKEQSRFPLASIDWFEVYLSDSIFHLVTGTDR